MKGLAQNAKWCEGYCKKHAREKGLKNSKKKNKTKKKLKKKKLEKKSNGTDFEEKEDKSKSTGKARRETRGDSIRKEDKERAHGRLAETPMPRTCGREIKDEKDEKDEKDVNGDMTPSSRRQAPQTNTPKIWPAQVHVVPDRFMYPRRQVVMSRSTPITQREKNKGMQSNVPAIPQSWR